MTGELADTPAEQPVVSVADPLELSQTIGPGC